MPATIKLNHLGSAVVTITDTGNIDAVGSLVITLSPSSNGMTPVSGITLATVARKVHLHDGGRAMAFPVRFKVTSALTAGNYQSYLSISFGNVAMTAAGGGFTAG